MSARLATLVCLLIALFGAGCAARRSGDALRGIRFEGNAPPKGTEGWFAPQNDRALRNAISQPEPSRLGLLVPGLVEPAWLDPDALPRDALRIEVWYANHGYFDARFLGWETIHRAVATRPDGTPRRRARPVVLVGHVEQGEPSRVRTVTLTGLDTLPGGAPLRNKVRDAIGLVEGEIFEREVWQESVAAVEGMLHERGFAHAKLASRIEVHPEERAVDVALDLTPGPVCRFGEVRVVGLEKVSEARLRLDIPIEPGARYSPRALGATRARLFGLGTFSVVDVYPDPEVMKDPTRNVIPVVVAVREGKFREIQAGPAFTYEPGRQTLEAAGSFQDHNFAGQLWQFEQTASVGPGASIQDLSELGSGDWLAEVVPVADLQGTLEIPHALLPNLSVAQDGRVRVAFQSGFRFFRPSWSPSVRLDHVLLEHASLQLAYRLQYTKFLEFTSEGAACDAETGEQLFDDYLLSGLEQTLSYDDRNDPISPNRGWYWNLNLAEFGGALGGNVSFLRGVGELRRFFSVPHILGFDPDQLVLAGRVGGGLVVPFGESAVEDVPVTERLKLGGGTTVRGWGADRLGPLGAAEACKPQVGQTDAFGRPRPDDGVEGTLEPLGGLVSLYGNLEARLGYLYDTGVVAFVDAGRVWATLSDVALSEVQVSVGAGIRYRTSIGPIRLDLAWRVGDPAEFADEPRLAVHLGLSGAF